MLSKPHLHLCMRIDQRTARVSRDIIYSQLAAYTRHKSESDALQDLAIRPTRTPLARPLAAGRAPPHFRFGRSPTESALLPSPTTQSSIESVKDQLPDSHESQYH